MKWFWSFTDIFSGPLTRLHSSCQCEEIEQKQLFQENHIFLVLGLLEKQFRLSGDKFSAALSKLHFKCAKKHFDEKNSLRKEILYWIVFGH